MSHAATKWAFDQPEQHGDMKPSEWAVLMVLADCHNPIYGCFPSQDYICQKTNLRERAVRDQLARLRERGLIDWDMARENGKRGSNRYRLAFEDGFQPANSAGSSTGENEHEQPADSDSFYRQNLPPNPVIEPVTEPVTERERARDSGLDDAGNRRRIEHGFKRTFAKWPTYVTDSEQEARKAWQALTDDERTTAEDRILDHVEHTRQAGRSKTVAFSRYLNEKLWERLPDKAEPPEQTHIPARVFGKAWNAWRLARLLAGPGPIGRPPDLLQARIDEGGDKGEFYRRRFIAQRGWPDIGRLHEQATRGIGHAVPKAFESVLDGFHQVRSDSPLAEAWKAEHDRRCWPWFEGDLPEYVWWPASPVAGNEAEQVRHALEAFEAALDAAGLKSEEGQEAGSAKGATGINNGEPNDGAAA